MARQMKDSGIEWIGEIHPSYQIVRLKFLLRESLMYGANESGIAYNEDLPRYIRITDITMDGKLKEEGKLSLSEDTAEGYLLNDDDILFARSGATVGKAFIYKASYGKAAFAGYLIKASVNEKVYADYLFFYTQSAIYEEWKKQIFVQATIQNIGADRYCNLPIVLPPLAQQKKIVNIISTKCAEIDAVIERTKATIEEYKKLKQAVITEAVTKGVRGPRPMKDSGIDWMGEVPQTFEIVKIKYVTDISRGLFNHRPRNDERYYGGAYPFIQTGDVAKANKYITTYSQTLNELGISVSKLFPKGTMTMTIAANVGDVAILGFDAYFPDSVVGFTPKEGFIENYVYYLFCSLKEMFIRTAVVSTQLNLNVERIKDIFVPVTTDTNEQKEIADYLDEKCATLDTLIAKKTALLTELETYKKSLIYEYVTGKKEVL